MILCFACRFAHEVTRGRRGYAKKISGAQRIIFPGVGAAGNKRFDFKSSAIARYHQGSIFVSAKYTAIIFIISF